jgi:hypothetical protein
MIRTMPFGKHRGERIDELPDEYVTWLLTIELREPLRSAVYREAEYRGLLGADDRGDERAEREAPPRLPAPDPEIVAEIVGAARRSLALRHHPDTGGDPYRMQAVNVACDWILEVARSSAA